VSSEPGAGHAPRFGRGCEVSKRAGGHSECP